MRLAEIIDSLSLARVSSEFGEIEISNVCAHSHECTPNCIFVCLDGYKDSGQRYIAEAIELGARVVVVRQRQDLNAETTYPGNFLKQIPS